MLKRFERGSDRGHRQERLFVNFNLLSFKNNRYNFAKTESNFFLFSKVFVTSCTRYAEILGYILYIYI